MFYKVTEVSPQPNMKLRVRFAIGIEPDRADSKAKDSLGRSDG